MTLHNSENDTNCAMLVGNLEEREKYQNQQPTIRKEIWGCWTQQEISMASFSQRSFL